MTRDQIIDFVREEVLPICVKNDTPHRPDIRIIGSVYRPTSRVWFVDIIYGQNINSIVVKCGTMQAATPHQRLPRLTPTVPATQMIQRQALVLRSIDHQLSALKDSRFIGVHVIMNDEERRILVMNRIQGDELLLRLYKTSLPLAHKARNDLCAYSRLAGEWLRLFHNRVCIDPGIRLETPSSSLYDQAVEWLQLITPQDKFWKVQVRDNLARWLQQLPDQPRAILHGDFWPGNILLSRGRIAVIDALGWVEGPVWLDIGYYLLHLRAVDRQVWLHNAIWPNHALQLAEREFLSGYFGEESIDPCSHKFFICLALLSKWARSAQVMNETTGLQRLKKRLTFTWKSAYYKSLLSQWINIGSR